MSLATEVTKTTSVWHDNLGNESASKEVAELNTIRNVTGVSMEWTTIRRLVSGFKHNPDLRQWLLKELCVQPALQDAQMDHILLAAHSASVKGYGMFNVYQLSYQLRKDGYQLIKK